MEASQREEMQSYNESTIEFYNVAGLHREIKQYEIDDEEGRKKKKKFRQRRYEL